LLGFVKGYFVLGYCVANPDLPAFFALLYQGLANQTFRVRRSRRIPEALGELAPSQAEQPSPLHGPQTLLLSTSLDPGTVRAEVGLRLRVFVTFTGLFWNGSPHFCSATERSANSPRIGNL
jgi:hypothetical protein